MYDSQNLSIGEPQSNLKICFRGLVHAVVYCMHIYYLFIWRQDAVEETEDGMSPSMCHCRFQTLLCLPSYRKV